MELIQGIENFKPPQAGVVATIGNFDGVHRGHRELISNLVAQARQCQLPSLVMVFEPQALEFFSPASAPARLMRGEDKVAALSDLGVDYVLLLSFDEAFSKQTPEDFISELLVSGVNLKHLIIGDDFHFGKNRSGDFSLLKTAGLQYGFEVTDLASVLSSCERVSSSLIRQALADADFGRAEQLLGYPYFIAGTVVHGRALGRTINVPTANIPTQRLRSPLRGVFAVHWEGMDGSRYQGLANLGTRPSVNGEGELLEVHLFDCDADLYGCTARVTFLKKMRNEQKFAEFELLKIQIGKDIKQARSFFQQLGTENSK